MRVPVRLFLSTVLVGAASQAAATDFAPPPRHESVSPMGVSYANGSFNFSEDDLSIGGQGPAGLSFSRRYNSAMGDMFSDFLFAHGWTHNFVGLVSSQPYPTEDEPLPDHELYIYNVSIGGKSVGFGCACGIPTGGYGGTYGPIEPSGASLVWSGTQATGNYVFTDSDGTVANFTIGPNGRMKDLTFPDGTRWDLVIVGQKVQSVVSNRGYAMVVEGNALTGPVKVCVINLAQTYMASFTTCPVGARSVTFNFINSPQRASYKLPSSKTDTIGQVTTYGYGGFEHVDCVKAPGQAVCRVQNVYDNCPEDPGNPNIEPEVHLKEAVLSQTTADGKQYGYAYSTMICTTGAAGQITVTDPLSGITKASASGGNLSSYIDPLNRTTTFGYSDTLFEGETGFLTAVFYPEGNKYWVETYDTRGNLTEVRLKAKTGSGLTDLVETRTYPATCTNRKTCNKATSKTDARGNTTDYTYDTNHGGLLTETGPAVNSIRPQKRYTYAQRYAWIKNSGGTYSQAATPVWLLTQEEFCKTTAASGSGCAGGASDEVVTTYDYGPNSGPNNLLLRGQVVTADGTSRRTCYSYDFAGNRISQTSPRAGLGSCP